MKVEIATADVPNLNNRVYTRAALENACTEFQGKECLGMLGMPEYTGLGDECAVDMNRVSHVVTNLRMEDDRLIGDVRVLDTPCGNIVRQLIEAGATPMFRSAGIGNIKQVGDHFEVTDFRLVSVNAVSDGA